MNIFGLGTPEILLIVFLLLLFFGRERLPGLAKSLADTLRELKSAFSGEAKNGTETSTRTNESEK
jgi:sec-independent protein translocase protein TatA